LDQAGRSPVFQSIKFPNLRNEIDTFVKLCEEFHSTTIDLKYSKLLLIHSTDIGIVPGENSIPRKMSAMAREIQAVIAQRTAE
jgi:hypothetical protein